MLVLDPEDGERGAGLVFGSAAGDQGRVAISTAEGLLIGGSFGDPGVEGSRSTEDMTLHLGTHALQSVGNADGFVALLDPSLSPRWVRAVQSPGFTVVKSAAARLDGWVVTGSEQREPVRGQQLYGERRDRKLGRPTPLRRLRDGCGA